MATNKKLAATITIGGAVSGTLTAAFGGVKGKLGEIGKTVTDLTKRQKLLGRAIQDFGRAGKNVDGLRNSYAKLSDQIDRARRAQERLTKAQAFQAKAGKVGGYLKSGAMYAGAGAAAIGALARPTIGAAIDRENVINAIRNSGVSKQDGDAMINAADSSKQFGVSVTKATETVSELRTALGDAHHAIEALPTALKAISGLQLYDRLHHTDMASGDTAYQLAKVSEERGGATDPEAMRAKYNWAFKGLTGSNGKITTADQLTAVRSGKGAVQAMSDEAFFGDTFLQQSMGADRYGTSSSTLVNAWIGGHQKNTAFQHMMEMGLLNKSGVKFDKNGNVNKVSPDALVDAQTFLKDPQKWVDQHLAPLAKSRGVDLNDPAAIMSFVNSITSNPNAANLLLSRLRFGANVWKDRNNVNQAHGVDESDAANKNSSAGKMDNAHARLNDAETRVGTVLLPAFTTAMEKTASVLERVNVFAKEHPALFKGIVEGVAGLGAAMLVAVPVLMTANGILTTIAMVKLARAAAEVTSLTSAMGGVEGAAGKAAGGVLGFIGKLGMAAGLVGIALAAAKAAGLPDTDMSKGAKDIKSGKWWAASFDLPAMDYARAWAARAAGKSNDEIAASLAGRQNPAGAKSPPAVPPSASAKPGATVNSSDTYTFNLTQAPGQSTDDFAKAVMKRIQQQQAKQSRSIMFDGASQ